MDKNTERFIRWQTVLRDHFTFLNNLLLTFAIGIVGFSFSLLKEPTFSPYCGQKIFFTLGLILLGASAICGMFTAFSRLWDFRTTAKKIRSRDKGAAETELDGLKALMDMYGKKSWLFFYVQTIFLIIGIANLMVALLWIYEEKLF